MIRAAGQGSGAFERARNTLQKLVLAMGAHGGDLSFLLWGLPQVRLIDMEYTCERYEGSVGAGIDGAGWLRCNQFPIPVCALILC